MFLDQALKKKIHPGDAKDSNLRSILKSVSWRILGTIDTIVISFLVTGKLTMALSIGSVEVVSKLVLYYLHERVWENISKEKTHETNKEFA